MYLIHLTFVNLNKFFQMNKWLLALLGYTFFRLPGAVLGFFIGSFFKSGVSKISNKDFEINLLALASMVIKAD